MRWTTLFGGLAVALVVWITVAAPVVFLGEAGTPALAAVAVLGLAVVASLALGRTDRLTTPYW
jgi:hypothetical protein